jgi:fructose-bisphosphate aldolase, class I
LRKPVARDLSRGDNQARMTTMANEKMMAQMSGKGGFIAALDQSGGSTPGALRLYGIPDSEYQGDDAKMFELVHEMRVRIIAAPPFTGDKVIAAILFERTMDGEAKGKPVPTYLWEERGVVPIVKVDKGLEAEKDGVSLMKPMPDLDTLGHQPGVENRHRRHRQAAVRIRRTDPEPRAHAHPRAGNLDQKP